MTFKFHSMDGDQERIGRGPYVAPPPGFDSLEGLMDHEEKFANQWYAHPGREPDEIMFAHIIGVCANGDIVPIAVDLPGNEHGKAELVTTLRFKFLKWKVVRYVFVSECWTVTANDDGQGLPLLDRPPSEHEDRREALVIVGGERIGKEVRKQGRCLMLYRNPGTNKVERLAEDPKESQSYGMEGRFATLLDPLPYHVPPDHGLRILLGMQGADPKRFRRYDQLKNWGEALLERYDDEEPHLSDDLKQEVLLFLFEVKESMEAADEGLPH